MTHKTKRVLLVENPNAGASDKQALLKELREGLLSKGFLVEQESQPESIQKCLRAASEQNNNRHILRKKEQVYKKIVFLLCNNEPQGTFKSR